MHTDTRLTLKEAAAHLRKSPSWLYHNRHRLGIRGHKIGGCWQFLKEDLDAYIESTAVVAPLDPPTIKDTSNKIVLVAS